MPEQLTVEERKKKLRGLTRLAFIPFYLIFVDECICNVYLAVFGGRAPSDAAANAAAAKHLASGRYLAVGVMFLLAYLWARPAMLYAKDPLPVYREKMRRRIGLLYPHLGAMFGAALLIRLALFLAAVPWRQQPALGEVLPALLLSTLV
jgi:hypothetical protein